MLLVLIGLAFIGFGAYKGVQYRLLVNLVSLLKKSKQPSKKNNDSNIMKSITKPQKSTMLLVMLYSLLLSPLFFYIWVFDRPELPIFLMIPLYSFWILLMIMDMRITLSTKNLITLYKSNIIFRNLYQKYKSSVAITLQLFIEISFVMLIPSLIFPREFGISLYFDYQTFAILAGIVGVIHLFAWHSNRQTVKKIIH
ncbi:hypothetical protein [Nitrosopumilus sp.]|uniref:hypothetical protein n=1 Tax=Nitrosopumilus sp. TaxID=2024843 RepID=UPI0029315C17|nr:hypothetical protein [Nitrosopumilus sp.]